MQLCNAEHQETESRERQELLLRIAVNVRQLAEFRYQKIVVTLMAEHQEMERRERKKLLIRLTSNVIRLAALREQKLKQRAVGKPRRFTRCRAASARLRTPALRHALPVPAAELVPQPTTAIARRDLLTPVITAAQNECNDGSSAAEVWAVLICMGEQRRPPLIGVTEDGIKWRNGIDEVKFFTIKNLRDRLSRDRKKTR